MMGRVEGWEEGGRCRGRRRRRVGKRDTKKEDGTGGWWKGWRDWGMKRRKAG